ncbi:hypothetical protein BN1356_00152 [Streptococcus varani]|uniref:Phage protein n=1 Tax=Streptococcus varani TaxID=1608583 RepID=A0A0E3WEJ4_9STRE|nr:DUF1642 domain-containing protein [Streptococcus varani]CQR23784.1 hypothetical protein BN1356_00152 [Streptococcus varani]
MNKTELTKRIEGMGEYEPFVDEPISKRAVLNAVSELTEPSKVIIPKFVAEWVEFCKEYEKGLSECLSNHPSYEMPDDVGEWFETNEEEVHSKEELVSRAWLEGYELEVMKWNL